jgi:hypothetical protein
MAATRSRAAEHERDQTERRVLKMVKKGEGRVSAVSRHLCSKVVGPCRGPGNASGLFLWASILGLEVHFLENNFRFF